MPDNPIKDIRDFGFTEDPAPSSSSENDEADPSRPHLRIQGDDEGDSSADCDFKATLGFPPNCKAIPLDVAIKTLVSMQYEALLSTRNEVMLFPKSGPNIAIEQSRIEQTARQIYENWRRNSAAPYLRKLTPRLAKPDHLKNAAASLIADAHLEDQRPVFMRSAVAGDTVVYDLGDKSGKAVVVNAEGYRVVDRSPVPFVRTKNTSPMPAPDDTNTKDIRDWVKDFFNMAEQEDYDLIAATAVSALYQTMDFPVVCFIGPPGSAKSIALTFLRRMVDPARADYIGPPQKEDIWVKILDSSYMVAIDNVTKIQTWLADGICRAATGGADLVKTLYETKDLTLLESHNFVAIAGIAVSPMPGDLGRRAVPFELTRVVNVEARDAMKARFTAVQPQVFAALLKALSSTLAKLPDAKSETPKRRHGLEQYRLMLRAFDLHHETETEKRFFDKVGVAQDIVLDSDPFAARLQAFMKVRTWWSGEPSQLLKDMFGDEEPPFGCPKVPNSLGQKIDQLTTALASIGINVERSRGPHKEGRKRIITLSHVPVESADPPSTQATLAEQAAPPPPTDHPGVLTPDELADEAEQYDDDIPF